MNNLSIMKPVSHTHTHMFYHTTLDAAAVKRTWAID